MGSSTREIRRLLARGLASGTPRNNTVIRRSDEDVDDLRYKNDRCRDRLNSVTLKEGHNDRQYEDIILQCLPLEYGRIRQTHLERKNCSLADIRRMMSKI